MNHKTELRAPCNWRCKIWILPLAACSCGLSVIVILLRLIPFAPTGAWGVGPERRARDRRACIRRESLDLPGATAVLAVYSLPSPNSLD